VLHSQNSVFFLLIVGGFLLRGPLSEMYTSATFSPIFA